MKRLLLLLSFIGSVFLSVYAADTVYVRETQIPILIERQDNVLYYLRLDARDSHQLDEIVLNFEDGTNLVDIQAVKLYYGGTESRNIMSKNRFTPMGYMTNFTPGKTMAALPSYSILKSEVKKPEQKVVLEGKQNLYPGINYFWISLQMKPTTPLTDKLKVKLTSVSLDGVFAPINVVSADDIEHRMGTGVRHAGDDGVAAYRIPGLVTTKKGTLLSVYDVRYNNSVDLQEHVDIGLSRSIDGGQSWEKMRIPLAFGEDGGLPSAQNGVGDPAILVNDKDNSIWIIALWTHGMGNQRAFFHSVEGMDKEHTGQLVLAKSTDDGKTWSAPINITKQVKHPSWRLLFQGPGRGITMQDGTLVFPIQFVDSAGMPHAGVMYSKDSGKNWKIHNPARSNTTEAQVVEIEPGILMLNMRDNRGGSRAVCITKDLGETWIEHPSSRSALREPVCMASLISVKAKDNCLKRDILLFSNPDTTKGRHHITIKASLDNGVTWLPEHQIMLDEDESWGYSCLTMVDAETVGILYESSVAQMTFQTVKLKDLIR